MSYGYLLALSVGDAFREVERLFGVRIQVELYQDPNSVKPTMLWWRVWVPSQIHRSELDFPAGFTVPYLSPSICEVDLQISMVIVGWLEELRGHLSIDTPNQP